MRLRNRWFPRVTRRRHTASNLGRQIVNVAMLRRAGRQCQGFDFEDRLEEIGMEENKLFERGFDLYRKYKDKDWGLIDSISFVLMSERGITDALTFDRHFEQAGFNALMN